MTDATQNLLMSFISGDREAAMAAAHEALDQCIHDFIFPDEAMDAGLDDASLGAMDGDMSELDGDGFEDDVEGDPLADLDAAPLADFDAPVGDEPDFDSDDDAVGIEDPMMGEGLEAPVAQNPELAAPAEEPGVDMDGIDATLAALKDVPASDVTGVEPVDGVDGEQPAATKNVTSVAIDPEQGDEMVKAIKLTYDDGTDFSFFTLASEVDKVCKAVQDAVGATPGLGNEELVAELSQYHPIFA